MSLECQHWAPRQEPETVPMPDDFEELSGEGLAALAKPLIRKKKPVINLSRWKAERNSKDSDLNGNREHLGTSSPAEERNRFEELKATPEESKIESAAEAVPRPRVTFTLPGKKNAGIVDFAWFHRSFVALIFGSMYFSVSTCSVGCALFLWSYIGAADEVTEDRRKPVEYAELSRLRSDSGASSRGEVKVTGVETARSGSEEASIDEENRAAIASMSAAEVAEAQAEIMSRLKPEVLEMLRTRRLKKGLKEHKEDEKLADAEPATGMKHESFPDRKDTVKSSHAPDILENRETPKDFLETEEKEKQTPAVQQGIAPQTEQGWPKSWTERVEAVRLHRFDMEGHLVAIDEAPIQETSGKSLFHALQAFLVLKF